jgi:transcriptional regulator with XRE-family HTH domain
MRLHLIKEKVVKAGITLKELCKEVGMTYQNLNRCLRDNKISANHLEKISEILNVPVYIFFDGYDDISTGTSTKKQWELEKEKILADIQSKNKELDFLRREIEMKDKIIGLLELR